MEYAIIKNGKVINVIVSEVPPKLEGAIIKKVSDMATGRPGPGDDYDEPTDSFTPGQKPDQPKDKKEKMKDVIKGVNITAFTSTPTGKMICGLICAVLDIDQSELESMGNSGGPS